MDGAEVHVGDGKIYVGSGQVSSGHFAVPLVSVWSCVRCGQRGTKVSPFILPCPNKGRGRWPSQSVPKKGLMHVLVGFLECILSCFFFGHVLVVLVYICFVLW